MGLELFVLWCGPRIVCFVVWAENCLLCGVGLELFVCGVGLELFVLWCGPRIVCFVVWAENCLFCGVGLELFTL